MIGYWNGYETYGNVSSLAPLGFLVMIIFWALIIAFAVLLIKRLAKNEGVLPNGRHNTALELLKERYAKGEIDTEEYEERKKVLSHK